VLSLHGIATVVHGFEAAGSRGLLRLRSPHASPEHSADIAVIRQPQELVAAVLGGFGGILSISDSTEAFLHGNAFSRTVQFPSKFDYLADGDILGFHPPSKKFRVLYRRSSPHNSFLVTERCNHYCLMCSQPPKDVDDAWILREIRSALPLVDKQTRSMGFTGGEPLLNWRDFLLILSDCRDILPQTAIHVLSNGRAFSSTDVVSAWAAVRHPSLTVGIPLYAAVDDIHDYVVQAKGAFDDTVLGILKLKDKGQRVEIRVVLHAITAPRIVATSRWIARNLPFIDHVALMGLENTGFAIANDKLLWIDPMDYRNQLAEAVAILTASRVPVSVYNLPRCVLDRSIWSYAAQSISDWKNDFLPQCYKCHEKPRCSGFFTTGRPHYGHGIVPVIVQ
jgi:His-Xaa-Ser system radical SAM maturase HxsC